MPEVVRLELEINATPSVTVTLDAVRTSLGHDGKLHTYAIVGVPHPKRNITLAKLAILDPVLAADLESVRVRLEPLTRRLLEEDTQDPDRLTKEVNRIAVARQALDRKAAEVAHAVNEGTNEVRRLEAERQAQRAAHEQEMKAQTAAAEAAKRELAELDERLRAAREASK